jgi:hypothetical protein
MISFSQFLVFLLFTLLLFGDVRKIFNKLILFVVNLKTLFTKKTSSSSNDKDEKSSPQ